MKIGFMNDMSMLSMNRVQNHEFSELKNKAQDKKNTKAVAQEFESLFIEMMFKEMKKTISKTNVFGDANAGQEIFDSMLNTEYAKISSKNGGFGLATMIEQSLNQTSSS
ncbi:MAG: rod-binding protein [Brevinema sp.]